MTANDALFGELDVLRSLTRSPRLIDLDND